MKHPQFADLFHAQLACASSHCDGAGDYLSDDGLDYLKGSLSLAADMCGILELSHSEPNNTTLLRVLNLKPWANYACDGVCNEIWAWIESLGDDDYWYETEEIEADDHTFAKLPPVVREVSTR